MMEDKPTYDELAQKVSLLERQLAELQEMREPKEDAYLSATIESTDDIIVIRDHRHRVVHANSAFKRIIRKLFSIEFKIGMRTTDHLPPEQKAHWEEVLSRVLKGEQVREEVSYTFKNGDTRHYDIFFKPVVQSGAIIGSSEWNRDITRLKNDTRALSRSRERYRSVLEAVDEGIVLQAASGEILTWNKGAQTILGVSAKEAVGRVLEAASWPAVHEDGSAYQEADYPLMRVLRTGKAIRNEVMGICEAEDRLKWLSINMVTLEDIRKIFLGVMAQKDTLEFSTYENEIMDRSGNLLSIAWFNVFTRDALGTIIDVTSLGVDLTERIRSEKQLKESEERFRALHNASFGGITIHDKGLILECNQGLSEITGYGHDELIGMNGLDLISDDTRETVIQNIAAGYEKPYEAKGLRKNGEVYPLRLEARNIPYKGKRVRVVEFRYISEQKRAEKETADLEGRLRQAQKMEAVGRLAGGVAHDFNNMLSVIIGNTELALEQLSPGQPLYDDLEEIKRAGERSADLTRQLLAFARKQTIAPIVIDLNRTVEGMTRMLQRLIGEDIDLAWLPGKNVWPVKMDPSQIDQILANLCVNARDAITDVGKVTIETGNAAFDENYGSDHPGASPGEYVLLSVSDDGCGMNTATLENIFEPFFTTKASGKGTGLGLATVYGAVKQNDGFITVDTEPGQGTTFNIYLPRYQVTTVARPEKTETLSTEASHETILVVEDEPAILRMTRIMLERLGHRVVAARTPGEAIEFARDYTGEIHLLVTDVVMPEMNGRDLARDILTMHPNLKCMFMSGYTADVIAHHGVLDKGVRFIQKPFSRETLGRRVREVLDGKDV